MLGQPPAKNAAAKDDAMHADFASNVILKDLHGHRYGQSTLAALGRKLVDLYADAAPETTEAVEATDNTDIALGDVVTLRSDRKLLTITFLEDDTADVAWFDLDGKYQEVTVPTAALRKYTDENPF